MTYTPQDRRAALVAALHALQALVLAQGLDMLLQPAKRKQIERPRNAR